MGYSMNNVFKKGDVIRLKGDIVEYTITGFVHSNGRDYYVTLSGSVVSQLEIQYQDYFEKLSEEELLERRFLEAYSKRYGYLHKRI